MVTWAIVPVKRLSESKSGLSSALTSEHRRELTIAMLGDVLNVLGQTSLQVLVVSPDEEVLGFAGQHKSSCLKEPDLGLNGALRLAIQHAIANGADSVLILPADLHLLKAIDI